MHRVGAADRLLSRLGKTEVANLSLAHEVGHRADDCLDRNLGIDAVLVEKIDVIGSQPLQRSFDCPANVLAIQPYHLPVFDLPAELRGDDDLVAFSAKRSADQFFIDVRPIHLGRVEEVDPQLQRAIDRGQRFLLVRRAVRLAHPHASKTFRGDDQTLRSESAFVHGVTLLCVFRFVQCSQPRDAV